MTKKKKLVIGISVAVAVIAALVVGGYFIIRNVFFPDANIERPFEGDGNEHTVTFDSNGGSAVPSVKVRDGNPVRRPDTPVKGGSFLIGWFEDVGLTDEWDFDNDRVKSDITLYAGWEAHTTVQPTASLVYEKDGDSYTVTGVGEDTVVVIPSEHDGSPVTKIGEAAFARKAITEITVPDSVVEIALNAFHNCSELVAVHIGEGSGLAAIGNNAFSGNSSLRSIYIPTGVTVIGDGAFNNDGAIDFTVAQGNAVYRSENGHLIANATNTLIRGGQSANVPASVTAIAQAAFRNSTLAVLNIPATVRSIGNYFVANSSIAAISFGGTEDEWNAIEKGRMWNSGNRDVEIRFDGGENVPAARESS